MHNETGLCGYTEEVSTARFVYICSAGLLALGGFLSNLLLLYVFATKRRSSSCPPSLYPAALSFLDALLCLLFILVFVVDVIMLYLQNFGLFVFYHEYIITAFMSVKVIQFLIPYMLILATMESRKREFFCQRARIIALFVIVVVALFMRLPAAVALTVTVFPDCIDPLRTLAVDLKEWAKENEWFTTLDVYFIAIVQTFLPFIVLLLLNMVIVHKLHTSGDVKESPSEKPMRKKGILLKHRSMRLLNSLNLTRLSGSVRNAVFTMVAIVSTYLVSNSLHILLTMLEVGKASILVDEEDPYKASMVYTLLGDAVSILYMGSSAIRIVIYMKCNRTIRKQVFAVLGLKKSGSGSSSVPSSA